MTDQATTAASAYEVDDAEVIGITGADLKALLAGQTGAPFKKLLLDSLALRDLYLSSLAGMPAEEVEMLYSVATVVYRSAVQAVETARRAAR